MTRARSSPSARVAGLALGWPGTDPVPRRGLRGVTSLLTSPAASVAGAFTRRGAKSTQSGVKKGRWPRTPPAYPLRHGAGAPTLRGGGIGANQPCCQHQLTPGHAPGDFREICKERGARVIPIAVFMTLGQPVHAVRFPDAQPTLAACVAYLDAKEPFLFHVAAQASAIAGVPVTVTAACVAAGDAA
jgi:hypothetical protein